MGGTVTDWKADVWVRVASPQTRDFIEIAKACTRGREKQRQKHNTICTTAGGGGCKQAVGAALPGPQYLA